MHNVTRPQAGADLGHISVQHMLKWPKSQRECGLVTLCMAGAGARGPALPPCRCGCSPRHFGTREAVVCPSDRWQTADAPSAGIEWTPRMNATRHPARLIAACAATVALIGVGLLALTATTQGRGAVLRELERPAFYPE